MKPNKEIIPVNTRSRPNGMLLFGQRQSDGGSTSKQVLVQWLVSLGEAYNS